MKKPPASTGGQAQNDLLNVTAESRNGQAASIQSRETWPWQDIDVSNTSALLRQGREQGWSAEHYQRIAEAHDCRFPMAALIWEQCARRVQK